MAYTLPNSTNLNTTKGADEILIYVASQVPIFFPMFLFAFFMVILIGGYMATINREGRGRMAESFAVAGFLTAILSILLTLIEGLIPIWITVLCVTIAILGVIWYLSTKE